MRMEIGEVERLDEVQSTWQTGSETLMTLKSGLGGTVAKMERAQHAQQAVGILDGKAR
jgi:kinetochor protein Mis14/NSL1